MPQWNSDRTAGARKYPDERWEAVCPADSVPLLLRYDHHTAWVSGRRALLLTYGWNEDPDNMKARRFEISFTYAAGHPAAPAEVQLVVDGLTFTPVPKP